MALSSVRLAFEQAEKVALTVRPAWSSAAFQVRAVFLNPTSLTAALTSPYFQLRKRQAAQPDSVSACPCYRQRAVQAEHWRERKKRSPGLKDEEKNHLCSSKALYSLRLHFESPGEALRDQVLHLFLHSWEQPQDAYPSLSQQVGVREFAGHCWSARMRVLPAHDAALMSP